MREEYNGRRRYLLHRFKEMELSCFEPFGAFYVFPCISEFGMTSEQFATERFKYREACSRSGNGIRRLRGRIYPYFLCVFAGEV